MVEGASDEFSTLRIRTTFPGSVDLPVVSREEGEPPARSYTCFRSSFARNQRRRSRRSTLLGERRVAYSYFRSLQGTS